MAVPEPRTVKNPAVRLSHNLGWSVLAMKNVIAVPTLTDYHARFGIALDTGGCTFAMYLVFLLPLLSDDNTGVRIATNFDLIVLSWRNNPSLPF
jgi:hypothetical protein